MHRRIGPTVLLLLLLATGAAAPAIEHPPYREISLSDRMALATRLRQNVALVRAYRQRDGVESLVEGFVVCLAPGRVVTALHVVEDADRIVVVHADGRTFPARIERRAADQRMALLRLEKGDGGLLPVVAAPVTLPEAGSSVYTLQGIGSAAERIVAGHLMGELAPEGPRLITTDLEARGGRPVFDDRGRLLGVGRNTYLETNGNQLAPVQQLLGLLSPED